MTNPQVQTRKAVREALAALLTTELGASVQAVYAHQKATFDGQSPVVCVISDGSERVIETLQLVLSETQIYLSIHIFVRYQDENWTEQQSEDQLDTLESTIMGVLLEHGDQTDAVTAAWIRLATNGASEVTEAIMDGVAYRHERIPIVARVGNIA